MQTTTILYIILALLISVAVAYFQYFYKAKTKAKITILLFFLKTLAFFLLLLLLINPKIKSVQLENTKPVLSLLIDHSKSIDFFKETKKVIAFKETISNNKDLQEKFNIETFVFDTNVKVTDTLKFNGNETNIFNGIAQINKLNNKKNTAIVLLTDGNQTIGNDYEYSNSSQKVYPVVFGDTTIYKDLSVTRVNANKYSYIKNKFPVEVLLNYVGTQTINTKFSIFSSGKTVFSKKIQFSKEEKSKIITTNLTSTREGLNYYTAVLQNIKDEKNIRNNKKNFSVEVIDEQSKILILTDVLHPDLGAFKKAIESNKQRTVTVFSIDKFTGELEDYQMVILYQPNKKFAKVFSDIETDQSNFLLVTGATTDWNFINKKELGFAKNAINQTENYSAIYNNNFLTFLQKDIGFNQFAPLKDKFGQLNFTKDHQDVLYQNINGLQTTQPLLSVLEKNNQKIGVLFGEGIWKWRANSFLTNNSFQDFDQFIGNAIQFIASKKKRKRLEVNAENIYPANSAINITAFYTDKNYNFDARASIEITVTNKATKAIQKRPFSLINNAYQTSLADLPSGEYRFKVAVLGQKIVTYGNFKITDYVIEEQFTNANDEKLKILADKTGGKRYYKDQGTTLIKDLLADKSYYTTQKSVTKDKNLIDFKWLLFIALSFFTVEWFIRKYYGKI